MKLAIFVNDTQVTVLSDDEVEEMVWETLLDSYPEMALSDDDEIIVIPIL